MHAVIVHAFSSLVCCFLAYAALKFIYNEYQMGSVVFLGIPSWVCQIILPSTFIIMAFRYLLYFLRSLLKIGGGEKEG